MDLPSNFKKIMQEAYNLISIDNYGCLDRGIRYKILSELGDIKKIKGNSGEAVTTIGRKRRAEVAFLQLERYKSFWYEELPENKLPEILINSMKEYINGKLTLSVISKKFDENLTKNTCGNYSYNGFFKASGFGYSMINAFMRVKNDYIDEIMNEEIPGFYDLNDNEIDVEQLDYEYLLSILYSGHYTVVNSEVKRREFWTLYLEDIITAYNSF